MVTLGQKENAFEKKYLEKKLSLGQKSPWTISPLDNHPLDNCCNTITGACKENDGLLPLFRIFSFLTAPLSI